MLSLAVSRKRLALACALSAVAVLGTTSASAAHSKTAAGSKIFNVTNLVSDGAITSVAADPALVNGWGLSATATSPWWVSNNGTNSSTLYNGAGTKSAIVVTVPGGPTGTVANTSATDFPISQGSVTGVSRFLFATEAGTILGWAPTVNATTAVTGVDNSAPGAVYKGLTTLNDRLYATDFHNARVDVFDASFKPVTLTNAFKDPKIPTGWAPFGIQALNGNIFVTYAMQDKAKHDNVSGGGLGYVDEYSPDGVLIATVASKGKANAPLNAPWGLAMAPASFGVYGGDLLVGNFGSGRIDAYQPVSPTHFAYKGVAGRDRRADHARRAVGDRLRQRCRGWTEHGPLLRRRADRREARAVRLDRRGVAQRSINRRPGGAQRSPPARVRLSGYRLSALAGAADLLALAPRLLERRADQLGRLGARDAVALVDREERDAVDAERPCPLLVLAHFSGEPVACEQLAHLGPIQTHLDRKPFERLRSPIASPSVK